LETGDGKTLAQSNTIARFLARKYNLMGKDEWEAAKVDEMVDVLVDIRQECIKHIMETDVEKKTELKEHFLNTYLPGYFKIMESQLEKKTTGNGKLFLVGDGLTWADLFFIHLVDMTETIVDPTILANNFPGLSALRKNVCEVPKVKEWLEKRPKTAR